MRYSNKISIRLLIGLKFLSKVPHSERHKLKARLALGQNFPSRKHANFLTHFLIFIRKFRNCIEYFLPNMASHGLKSTRILRSLKMQMASAILAQYLTSDGRRDGLNTFTTLPFVMPYTYRSY